MKVVLFRIGFWLIAKAVDDLSEEHLTVENADKLRTDIIDFIDRRFSKALKSKRIVADEKFWWFWGRVMKSTRLQGRYDQARGA